MYTGGYFFPGHSVYTKMFMYHYGSNKMACSINFQRHTVFDLIFILCTTRFQSAPFNHRTD